MSSAGSVTSARHGRTTQVASVGVFFDGPVALELLPRIEAVLADQLAQVLAIDLRFARGRRQVHLVPAHQILDVLALEHLDELALGFLERQIGPDAEARRRFADERVLEIDRRATRE